MRSNREVRFRTPVFLALGLLMAAVVTGQTVGAAPSAESWRNPVKQRLEQILAHFGQTASAGVDAQPLPTRVDPRSPDDRQRSPLEASRLPGAPIAAERYVFGRMDLATGDNPNAVATGAFQNGGPQSIAVANYYSSTVSILLANPDGTFQPRVDYATGVEPALSRWQISTATTTWI